MAQLGIKTEFLTDPRTSGGFESFLVTPENTLYSTKEADALATDMKAAAAAETIDTFREILTRLRHTEGALERFKAEFKRDFFGPRGSRMPSFEGTPEDMALDLLEAVLSAKTQKERELDPLVKFKNRLAKSETVTAAVDSAELTHYIESLTDAYSAWDNANRGDIFGGGETPTQVTFELLDKADGKAALTIGNKAGNCMQAGCYSKSVANNFAQLATSLVSDADVIIGIRESDKKAGELIGAAFAVVYVIEVGGRKYPALAIEAVDFSEAYAMNHPDLVPQLRKAAIQQAILMAQNAGIPYVFANRADWIKEGYFDGFTELTQERLAEMAIYKVSRQRLLNTEASNILVVMPDSSGKNGQTESETISGFQPGYNNVFYTPYALGGFYVLEGTAGDRPLVRIQLTKAVLEKGPPLTIIYRAPQVPDLAIPPAIITPPIVVPNELVDKAA